MLQWSSSLAPLIQSIPVLTWLLLIVVWGLFILWFCERGRRK